MKLGYQCTNETEKPTIIRRIFSVKPSVTWWSWASPTTWSIHMSFFTKAPWQDDPMTRWPASQSSQDHPRKGCTADQNQSLICGSPKMWEKYGEIANTSNMCCALLGHVYHLLSVITCYNHLYAPNGNLNLTEPFEVDKDAVKQWQRVFFVFFAGGTEGLLCRTDMARHL